MNTEDVFEYLMLAGIVEFAGLDTETGEMLYRFTENLEEIDPEMFKEVLQMISQDIYALWEKGFLNMDVTLANPIVSLNDKALDNAIISSELSKELQRSLEVIKLYMSN